MSTVLFTLWAPSLGSPRAQPPTKSGRPFPGLGVPDVGFQPRHSGTQGAAGAGRSMGDRKRSHLRQFFLQRHLGQNRHLRCWGSHGTGGMPILLPNLQTGPPAALGTLRPRAWAARGPGPEQRSPGFQETECVGAEATRLRPRPREQRGGPWPCSGEPGPPPRGRVCLSLSRPVRLLRAPV